MSPNTDLERLPKRTSKTHCKQETEHGCSKHGNDRKSNMCRIRDRAFSSNIKRSAAVAWALFLVGWLKGIIGPSFPEILYLTETSLEKGSAYLTVLYTCKILGHALGGLLYDKLDRNLYTAMMTVLNAFVLMVFPWCRIYGSMITMYGLHGLMISSLELGLITDIVNLWDGEARQTYLQITMFIFSIATIASPLAIIPFLMTNFTTATGNIYNGGDFQRIQNFTYDHNKTGNSHLMYLLNTSNITSAGNQTFSNISMSSRTSDMIEQQSNLYLGFTLAAFLVLTGGVPFACFYFSQRCSKKSSYVQNEPSRDSFILSKSEDETTNDVVCSYEEETKVDEEVAVMLCPESSEVHPAVSKCDVTIEPTRRLLCTQPSVILLFIVSCVFGALHSAMEISMSDMLPVFCQQFLKWPASQAAMAVSLLYFFLTVGRIICAVLVKLIALTKVIGIFVVFIILGSAGLSVSANVYSTPGTWVSIGVIGLGVSACYPSQLGWTSKYLIPLTGKLTAVLLCTMYVGSVVAPPLMSYLMTNYSYPFFCYGMIAMAVITFVCVLLMALYVSKVEQNNNIRHQG
ncbi:uncharacterized protein LOC117344021 [Pecten maximus]|uniref:uncharacterized protein LOC117344021 n=1 Tax=Pecten maximus TaxID=6579 RepID=UPI0014586B8C|nr:uncharacterized protein LOC117344021 [Pecten maximus]